MITIPKRPLKYGKVLLEIDRSSTAANPVQKITYTYDASGNRISKTVLKNNGSKSYTWYVRDAQGNVMATYSSHGSAADLNALPLVLSERHLYGSSRLGMYTGTVNVDDGPRDMADSNSVKYYRGYRQYELTNHLGNVLATISDKKKPVDTDSDGSVDYFDADVVTAQDYYPFGMLMPGRVGYRSATGWSSQPGEPAPDHGLEADIAIDGRDNNQPPEYTATKSVELTEGFESGAGDEFTAYISPAEEGGGDDGSGRSSLNGGYRYGFNGKENDNEVKGTGNQQDYGMRIYDPRLGRFLSIDPIAKSYPELSLYQFASNSPINSVDIDGLEQWELSSPGNNLKRMESQYKVVLNPLQNQPAPKPSPEISQTSKSQIQKSIKYTEQVKTMNRLYNSDEGWSFRIFSGIGESAMSFAEGEVIGYTVGKVGQGIKYLKNAATSSPKLTFVVPEPPPISTVSNKSIDGFQTFSTPSNNTGFKSLTELGIKDGMKVSSNQALELGEQFLGKGYTEPVRGSGRYVSADGTRVFRMGTSDITGAHGGGPHVNFETLIPNPAKPAKMMVDKNIHVYLND